MNINNYVTLEQAKEMKKLGYPQDKTDCVWLYLGHSTKYDSSFTADYALALRFQVSSKGSELWAAPNAQEIELNKLKVEFDRDKLFSHGQIPFIKFGNVHHAQDRADAWIWERKNV